MAQLSTKPRYRYLGPAHTPASLEAELKQIGPPVKTSQTKYGQYSAALFFWKPPRNPSIVDTGPRFLKPPMNPAKYVGQPPPWPGYGPAIVPDPQPTHKVLPGYRLY